MNIKITTSNGIIWVNKVTCMIEREKGMYFLNIEPTYRTNRTSSLDVITHIQGGLLIKNVIDTEIKMLP